MKWHNQTSEFCISLQYATVHSSLLCVWQSSSECCFLFSIIVTSTTALSLFVAQRAAGCLPSCLLYSFFWCQAKWVNWICSLRPCLAFLLHFYSSVLYLVSISIWISQLFQYSDISWVNFLVLVNKQFPNVNIFKLQEHKLLLLEFYFFVYMHALHFASVRVGCVQGSGWNHIPPTDI